MIPLHGIMDVAAQDILGISIPDIMCGTSVWRRSWQNRLTTIRDHFKNQLKNQFQNQFKDQFKSHHLTVNFQNQRLAKSR